MKKTEGGSISKMLTLSFDTAAKVATVAVCDGERTLALYSINNGLTQSELILPMAESILKSLGLGFSDVELLATSVGPGSFTGVRIGVSLVKGIAFGRKTPVVGVSTLEALAYNARGLSGLILPVMDARRGEVYTATFIGKDGELIRKSEDRAIPISLLAEELREVTVPIYLVGDGYTVAKKALTELQIKTEDTPLLLRDENAASVGAVAYIKYKNGEVTDDLSLSPLYLRLPQAERERLEREGQSGK